MDISINWIKDFVKLPEIDSQELAVKFTMATCEVEEVKETNSHLKKVITAQVTDIADHPDSDKLHLVTVNTGAQEITVVCGAPDVNIGDKVPYAPLGTTFPEGFTLVPKKIRGIESKGMLCGEDELGLGSDKSKLMDLPKDANLGTTMSELFNIESDTILDIDNKSITHRPDLWGHFGMAREFALVFDSELNNKFDSNWEKNLLSKCGNGNSPITPKIEGDTNCKAYYGLSIDGVEVAESPKWIKERLEACGLRPINSIVDISNYVMLELGIPNHIFDRDSIENSEIIIRAAGSETDFTTLDDIKRTLLPTDTVVADSSKPLVIAGIMGGANSGVTEKTSKIFIESANWTDVEVRKTSTRIGLRTDSSQRYEKSLDSQLLQRSLLRITELILELNPNAKIIGNIEKTGIDTETEYTPKVIKISTKNICKVLGKDISDNEITGILAGLAFSVENDSGNLVVTVPSFRATKDVEYDADIIEEIGRIVGYDNIAPEPAIDIIKPIRLSQAKLTYRKIQNFMVFNGNSLEVMTNPMIGESLLKKAKWLTLNEELKLINALSNDHDRMRPSMVPSFLEMASLNSKNFTNFSTFEIGRSYLPNKKNFSQENNTLAIAMFDKKESQFMSLVNLIERLIKYLNIPAQIVKVNSKFPNIVLDRDWQGIHPYEQLDIRIMGRNLGTITTIHPIVAREFKIKGNLTIALIDISVFEANKPKEKVNYKPLPKFPSSTFDCTVLVDNSIDSGDIIEKMSKIKIKELNSCKVVGVFALNDTQKAVTLRATFFDEKQTLSGKFIEEAQTKIVEGLANAGFPLKV